MIRTQHLAYILSIPLVCKYKRERERETVSGYILVNDFLQKPTYISINQLTKMQTRRDLKGIHSSTYNKFEFFVWLKRKCKHKCKQG